MYVCNMDLDLLRLCRGLDLFPSVLKAKDFMATNAVSVIPH